LQQLAAVLLPLPSTVFHAHGNFPGSAMENSGKPNPKMGFKSPPGRGEKSAVGAAFGARLPSTA
jgi:hypothetical protein